MQMRSHASLGSAERLRDPSSSPATVLAEKRPPLVSSGAVALRRAMGPVGIVCKEETVVYEANIGSYGCVSVYERDSAQRYPCVRLPTADRILPSGLCPPGVWAECVPLKLMSEPSPTGPENGSVCLQGEQTS